jgi:hypothetical protein
MSTRENETKAAMTENRDLFIDGYFGQRVNSGDRPKYGYPTNHLPETTIARMELDTSFMASRKSK